MTRIENVKNVIEYYCTNVAFRICKYNDYYYLMCLQSGENTTLYSYYTLERLKKAIEQYARPKVAECYCFEGYSAEWSVEWVISRVWSDVLSEIMGLQEIEDFELAMRELEKIKEIPGDPCCGPVYFGVE